MGDDRSGSGKPVRIHRDVVKMAERIAAYRGVSLSSFLSDLVRPAVVAEYRKALDEMERLAAPGPNPPSGPE